jgi:penicillin-insensitive murein endopeptidase
MIGLKSAIAAFSLLLAIGAAEAQQAARDLFGAARTPAPLEARSLGSYARGCLAGAMALPVNGPTWQVMRLSRNRNWGNPALIAFLERLAEKAPLVGWNGLLVGDMAQPRGGPMSSGHASHQIGLDADIWLTPMPSRVLSDGEREEMSAISMLDPNNEQQVTYDRFTIAHARIIRAAAEDDAVARIFVNPAIKQALCDIDWDDRSWLRTVRPWWGHDYHFHVRMSCPAGQSGCENQAAPPPGDGCGEELAAWFRPAPEPEEPAEPAEPRRPLTLADLPPACSQVLMAP